MPTRRYNPPRAGIGLSAHVVAVGGDVEGGLATDEVGHQVGLGHGITFHSSGVSVPSAYSFRSWPVLLRGQFRFINGGPTLPYLS